MICQTPPNSGGCCACASAGSTGNSASNSVGCSFLQTDFEGGRVVYDSTCVSTYDPNTPVDFDNIFQPGYSYFSGDYAGGQYTRIDLYRGHLGDFQIGLAAPGGVGVWVAADIPAYIGQNFRNTAIVSGTRPAARRAPRGSSRGSPGSRGTRRSQSPTRSATRCAGCSGGGGRFARCGACPPRKIPETGRG